MSEVDDMLKGVSDLSDKLEDVKATQYKHTQVNHVPSNLHPTPHSQGIGDPNPPILIWSPILFHPTPIFIITMLQVDCWNLLFHKNIKGTNWLSLIDGNKKRCFARWYLNFSVCLIMKIAAINSMDSIILFLFY